ncbi:hypothetical protein L6452_22825 [Arctium lappa]|uniref:Uncharacterized protein n=1 Tax=Arctium lappa TaxID=4217 RepID=A0ACB9B005_ARCLA|nr:hypothetical protein L6452_22825 [Arctium lappa]
MEVPSHGTPVGTTHEEQVEASTQEIVTTVVTTIATDVDPSAVLQDVATLHIESVIATIESEDNADVREDANLDETVVADDDVTNPEVVDDDMIDVDLADDDATNDVFSENGDKTTSDSDAGDDDDNQLRMKVYERKSKTPEVLVSTEVLSDDDSVPVNPSIAHLQVDELDTTFDQATALVQSQAPATTLADIRSTSAAVELTSDQARVSTDKFSTLNDVIRQLSERMDAEKEAQIMKLKALFKGKMPEIDTLVIPTEIPFRRPSGVVLREPSSAVQSSAPAIMSIPLPPLFTQSVGISSSTSIPVSSSSTPDLPISELKDLLYARLISISPPEHQDQDLISLLRNFQPTPPPVYSSESDRIYVSSTEFQEFKSEVRSSLSDLRSFMTQAFSDLSNKIDHLDQSCRTEVGPSLKRRHDQDDPDHQGHEGEMAKRQRTEGSSEAREVGQEGVVGYREKNVDTVQDCSIQDLMDVMIDNADVTTLHNEFNLSEANFNNMQVVVYVDPDVSGRANEVEESEAANDMRSFFANFIEINSDDDEEVRFEKVAQVEEEDCNNIIILSETEDDSVFMDATDTKEAELLYADLPSQGEIPEVDQPSSTPVTTSSPTTNISSSAFEVGESSRTQVVIPSSEPVIPPSLLEEGEALTRQQRQRNLQQRYMASRLRTAFLEDIQSNIFVSRRRTLNIYAILGVEKESEAYQHEYLAFIKCQRRRNNTVNSPHLIVRVLSVTICKFMNIWYPNLEVERRDCKRYIFSEADFVDLSIDDIDFLYDHFRNLYHRTQDVSQTLFVLKRFIRRQIRFFHVFDFQMAVESFQPVVNLERPNQSLQNLESYPLFTIIEDPFGVVYKNNSSEKCFLRFDEVGYYSDGTLKVIKLQLEHRLQEARRKFLESRRELYILENDEIRLIRRSLNTIQDRLNLRSTLRRLEVLVGLNRLRQREEHQ